MRTLAPLMPADVRMPKAKKLTILRELWREVPAYIILLMLIAALCVYFLLTSR